MYFYVIKRPKPPQNVYLLFTMLILVQSMLCNEILVFLKIFSLLVIGVLAFGLKISKNLLLCGQVLIQKIWQMVAGVPQGKYFKSCLGKGMVKICLFTFQEKEVCSQIFDLEKCFKICYVYVNTNLIIPWFCFLFHIEM